MTPKEMPFHKEILGAIRDSLFGGQKESAIVIFEHMTIDCGFEVVWKLSDRKNFKENRPERQ
jgi:hypothetical protein